LFAIAKGLNVPGRNYVHINEDWSRVGLGIGDDTSIAKILAQKFTYTNTHIDKFPKLDLLDENTNEYGVFEFISCSDVLEHISGSVQSAITEMYNLLRLGGFVAVSVPIASVDQHEELYPNLMEWKSIGNSVHWKDTGGTSHIEDNPEWHGGDGLTLAFRRWSARYLKKCFLDAGFQNIDFVNGVSRHGTYSENELFVSLVARKL
jgi:SAM-dependent methyltransferase